MADSHKIEISVVPKEAFKIGSFSVTETMVSSAITVFALLLLAVVVRVFFIPRWAKEHKSKSGFRILIEYVVNMFDSNAGEQTHHYKNITGPFYFSCSAFICIATLLEVFSFRPATSDMSFGLVFGLLTFIMIVVLGLKSHAIKRLKHYANPLFTLTDAVVPISITLRMFGSVFCGYLIMHLIYDMLPVYLLATGIIGALGTVMFTIFHALIQAYVFMFLSMSLINEAIE